MKKPVTPRDISRAHKDILICLTEAFNSKNIGVIESTVRRLNDLTVFIMDDLNRKQIKIGMLEAENSILNVENDRYMDEAFLSISDSKGRYTDAKKRLDELYGDNS